MKTTEKALNLIRAMITDGIVNPQDLSRFVPSTLDPYDPENIRREMENWYISLGIESIIGQRLSLSHCTFTKEEIEQAVQNNEIILCVPNGITAKRLGELFRIDSWALDDPLITKAIETEDFWFKTLKTFEPPYQNKPVKGKEGVRRIFENEGKLGFSLQRYLVFIARMRHLTGNIPDMRWWTWLLNNKYDSSAYLIAGFDPNEKFSVHAWMSDFKAKFVGARYIIIPDRI